MERAQAVSLKSATTFAPADLFAPGMGVNLWSGNPLYMNPVPSFYDVSESTSRRQGRHRGVCRKPKCKTMSRRTEIAYNPDYAVAKFAKDARRRVRRCSLVLQAPDNKADSVK